MREKRTYSPVKHGEFKDVDWIIKCVGDVGIAPPAIHLHLTITVHIVVIAVAETTNMSCVQLVNKYFLNPNNLK